MALYNSPDNAPAIPITSVSKGDDLAKNLVPQDYYDYLVLFSEKEARILPPSRYIDHAIPLIEGSKPLFGHMYSMSDSELKEVEKWIDENLSISFIRASSSSAAWPILFIKKKDVSLRLYVDYRALNNITVKDRTPLPRIEEAPNQIRGYKYFTQLDLQACFNQIRIKEGDEWKTSLQDSLWTVRISRYALWAHQCSCYCRKIHE